jgi:hypothetical protein
VRLPIELAAEIDKIVGKKNRSAFASEIVEREVRKLRCCARSATALH